MAAGMSFQDIKSWGHSSWRHAYQSQVRKLEWWGLQKKLWLLIDTISEHDRRTEFLYQNHASALLWWRAIKTVLSAR